MEQIAQVPYKVISGNDRASRSRNPFIFWTRFGMNWKETARLLLSEPEALGDGRPKIIVDTIDEKGVHRARLTDREPIVEFSGAKGGPRRVMDRFYYETVPFAVDLLDAMEPHNPSPNETSVPVMVFAQDGTVELCWYDNANVEEQNLQQLQPA